MKKTIQTILLFFITLLVYSQSKYPLSISIKKGSNWDLKVDTIAKSLFDHSKVHKFNFPKINQDSILKSKAITYPESITMSDFCYILKGIDKNIELCKRRLSDDRQWTDFEFCFTENNYLIFKEIGYESWNYIVYNPQTRLYSFTSGIPIFIDKDLFYSYGNRYIEGMFELVDIKNNKSYRIDTFNWELKNLYKINTTFHLELVSNDSYHEHKYLSISYEL
ncbi:hypothetical protein [Flavivirga rizhaonensis]|uniref:Uncharacterized protein n=1 Tax=Flavivirga rizhaonensis TaxID=2559571 RepID=A0A4S1DTV8_9FLAO|nr:hypothetical protein [Flavivirga rizhaonensis]TGV01480.1 hypothetical protein EM932_15410 [Flavivirga rizhaonensis]